MCYCVALANEPSLGSDCQNQEAKKMCDAVCSSSSHLFSYLYDLVANNDSYINFYHETKDLLSKPFVCTCLL